MPFMKMLKCYQSEIFFDRFRDDCLSAVRSSVVKERNVRGLVAAPGSRVGRQALVLAAVVVALRVAVTPVARTQQNVNEPSNFNTLTTSLFSLQLCIFITFELVLNL